MDRLAGDEEGKRISRISTALPSSNTLLPSSLTTNRPTFLPSFLPSFLPFLLFLLLLFLHPAIAATILSPSLHHLPLSCLSLMSPRTTTTTTTATLGLNSLNNSF
ncbi:hypothetical protein E2C01_095494 [Portunus trituberculatus]|uniref:Uncharacterized protein n=1 Tax=Portunus trituberculatus TaxID=210409 RepID=A0A5B7JZJ1_PORTR|nr:hypothetical protein [Portunus trituberculatus]